MTERSKVWIFNRRGERLCEYEANCRRAWKISDVSSASLDVALSDPKATLDNMRFGNHLYVEHDSLPSWGGIVYTPRVWGYGTVTLNAYDMGEMLKHRVGPAVYAEEVTPGEHFRNIIKWANAIEDSLIVPGEIDDDGAFMGMEFHLTTCYDALRKLTEESGWEWEIVPEVRDNRLGFVANFQKKLGLMRPMQLIEDKNIRLERGNFVSEQGEIANHVIAFGSAGSWESRPIEEVYDDDSRSDYGFFEKAVSVSGDKVSRVKEAAKAELERSRHPRRTFRLNAVQASDSDDTFANLRLGDIVGLQLVSVGFTSGGTGLTTRVRVLGMQFDDLSGVAELVVDEVLNE